jgi:hypothetical protein
MPSKRPSIEIYLKDVAFSDGLYQNATVPLVHELSFIQALFSFLFGGKIMTALKFTAYRIASWLGIGFFWKKGKDSGQKKFYWISFFVWLISWSLVLYFSPKVWRLATGWFHKPPMRDS